MKVSSCSCCMHCIGQGREGKSAESSFWFAAHQKCVGCFVASRHSSQSRGSNTRQSRACAICETSFQFEKSCTKRRSPWRRIGARFFAKIRNDWGCVYAKLRKIKQLSHARSFRTRRTRAFSPMNAKGRPPLKNQGVPPRKRRVRSA